MDHIVYVDASEGDLEKLLSGIKRMVIRGAAGRKLPHGRVAPGDQLYFIRNNGEGVIRASAPVIATIHSEKLSEDESRRMVEKHQEKLQLTPAQFKRWAGKRYLVLIEVGTVNTLEPFVIDRSQFGNMDDWLPVGDIDLVRVAASTP